MSVTFMAFDSDGNAVGGHEESESPCICAQMAPSWTLEGEMNRIELREHANPGCRFCTGSGVEMLTLPNLSLNLSNVSARNVLVLLGWCAPGGSDDHAPFVGVGELLGERTIPEARRGLMVARARFDRLAPGMVRPAEIQHGHPRVRDDGTVELRPVVYTSREVDVDDIGEKLESFASFIGEAAKLGAVTVSWG